MSLVGAGEIEPPTPIANEVFQVLSVGSLLPTRPAGAFLLPPLF